MQASARLSSSVVSKRVIAGVSSTIARSCHRTCRGKAHAAPLSSQEAPKGPKRISKAERKDKIVKFVEEYKASNDGKSPSMTTVRQRFGGSHYTVREIFQELEYNQIKLSSDKSKAAQLHDKMEFSEHSKHGDNNGNSSFSSESSSGKQDMDDLLLSWNVAATSIEMIDKAETLRLQESSEMTPSSSHYNGETGDAKQGLHNADNLMSAKDSITSCQTESDGIKTEDSISLGLEIKSDPCDQGVGERKVDKLELNNTESFENASEKTVSDHTDGDKMTKANVLEREESADIEPKTSFLGSLKSFTYGIRNFWKKL